MLRICCWWINGGVLCGLRHLRSLCSPCCSAWMRGASSLAPFITLQQLEQRGWLALELVSAEQSLVTLEPQSTALKRLHPPAGIVCVRWSRFVQITPETGGVLLEGALQGSGCYCRTLDFCL